MSLITQRTNFSNPIRNFVIEGDPNDVASIEELALILGGTKDPIDPHEIRFYFNNQLKEELVLQTLELAWSKLRDEFPSRITLSYENESLVLEGDTLSFITLQHILKLFDKELVDDAISFSFDESDKYFSVYDAAIKLGMIPS